FTSSPRNYEWVLEADIKACFDEIDHTALLNRLRVRVKDRRVCALVQAFLKAGVMTVAGDREETPAGTPQGSLCSAEHNDPCGVPRSRVCKVPSACCNGAASHRFTYNTTHESGQCASTALTIRSHGTESKNFSTSRSMPQSLLQPRFRHAATASRADLFGR